MDFCCLAIFFFFFVEFFLNLLETGQRELDVMFSTAYGLQYKQNQDVFNQLFANFQRYYKGGDISLNEGLISGILSVGDDSFEITETVADLATLLTNPIGDLFTLPAAV